MSLDPVLPTAIGGWRRLVVALLVALLLLLREIVEVAKGVRLTSGSHEVPLLLLIGE